MSGSIIALMSKLELIDINYRFPDSNNWSLSNVNFEIQKGQLAIITGPSGSGKSSILRIIRGLHREINGEISGQILVDGYNCNEIKTNRLGSIIGIVFQNPSYQLHQPRAIDEIISAPLYQGLPYNECLNKAFKAANGLVDDALLSKNPSSLSLGQQQRVAISASLSLDAELLLCDEPFSYLDSNGILELKKVILKLLDEGKTILIATHDIEPLVKIASKLIIINQGKVVACDKPTDVLLSKKSLLYIGVPLAIQISRIIQETNINDNPPICWEDIAKLLNPIKEDFFIKSFINKPRNETIISFENVSYSYPEGVQAISKFNLQIQKGQIISLLGPNGSGKSTLVKLILGFLRPQEGTIRVFGKKPTKLRDLAKYIGYVSQNPADIIFETTVYKECAFGPKVLSSKKNLEEIVITELSKVGLQNFLKRDPRSLSGGEQRLLNIACVLINNPEILILDEPEFGLDVSHITFIENLIRSFAELGRTVIIITHKFELAAFLNSNIILFSKGESVFTGNTIEFLLAPFHNDFLGVEDSFYKCLKNVTHTLGYVPDKEKFKSVIANQINGG